MKEHIQIINNENNLSFPGNDQAKWEFLKYEIRKFTISYSKKKNQKS